MFKVVTDQPTARIVAMTPEKARLILEKCNHRNRGCEDRRVRQYAGDMTNGGWLFTGEAIKVSTEGILLDGQHRLWAVVESGRTQELLVITGLDPKAQEVMDQGVPRSLGDSLHIRGDSDPNNLASALRTVAHYQRDGIPFQASSNPGMSHGYALRLFDAGTNREDLIDALNFVRRYRKDRTTSLSALAGLHFLFAAADADRAEDFTRGVLTGESTLPAARQLRQRFVDEWDASVNEDIPRQHIKARIAFTVMAWNAGAELVPGFRWRIADGFPAIRGLDDDADLELRAAA
jgi:hypothetical protein